LQCVSSHTAIRLVRDVKTFNKKNLPHWQASSTFGCGNPHRGRVVTNLEFVEAGLFQTRRRPLRQATHTSSMASDFYGSVLWDAAIKVTTIRAQ